MMPPTRIEQLNNFQDAVQSPDGLDRLRALQSIEQALPSSQGLMGMPQVQAPMPMVPRQYGGEIGTGGLVEVLDDGTQVFDNTEEGILNRSLHGGMLQGQTQTATAPSSFSGGTDAAGTLASGTSAAPAVLPKTAVDSSFLSPVMDLENVQQRGGIYNASDIRDAGITLSRPSDAPETIVQNVEQVGSIYRDPHTGKIPIALYRPQPVNTFGQGYDLKDMDYFTANALALSEGADRFMYNDEYAAVDPGLLSNYDYSRLGTKPYSDSMERDKIREATIGPMHAPGRPGVPYTPSSADQEEARLIAEGFTRDYSGRLTVPGVSRAERYRQLVAQGVNMDNPYQRQLHGFKHGGSLADTAQGLASFGRYGDNILVHMNPEELSGLASLGQITYNPVTGLPEAFSLKGIFKSIRKIAPIALAIAAPYAFGATTALGIGASTALGSFAGNLIAGAKPGDALKQGLLSGLFAGGGAYLGGASSGLGGSAAQSGTSAVTSGASGGAQGGLTINNPAFQSSPLKVALQGPPPNIGNTTARGISQFTGGNVSGASSASLAGSVDKMIPQSNLVFKSGAVPKTYSQSIGSANQIGLGNANVASNVARSGQFSPNVTNQITSFGGNQGANLASNVGQGPTSIFAKGGFSKENLSRMGSQIYDDYANPKGIAKLVAMDLSTPDYDVMYANEAREKEQQLREAGYTVDTGFDGQTVIRDSSGVTLPRNLTASMILDRALGRAPRTNLVARTDYATAKEGGLISLKHGGEFSGMVPGEGHGMEDNVYMPITEGKKQVGTLAVSPSEYVVDSYTMAALGNGNADAGAKVMDKVVKHVRKKAYGNTEQPNEISGLQALKPMMERV
mgnify:FL=1|tara:strand:+ start:3615 stop:6164 length:2550 start_codon:yes stop_codon:yes gene_type:complete